MELLAYGEGVAPLSTIGRFLTEVGESVKQTILKHSPTSAYHCDTEVIRLQQLSDSKLWKITARHVHSNTPFEIYAVAVVLATGGEQSILRVPVACLPTKLIWSDVVCTEAGIEELTNRLRGVVRKRVVIIGGAHSAFSSAWICLNKLGWYNMSEKGIVGTVCGNPPPPPSIYIVHRTPIKVHYSTKKEADMDKYTDCTVNKHGQIHPFSGLRGDAKELYRRIKSGAETRVRCVP